MKRGVVVPLVLVCAGLALAACTRKHSLYLSPGEREEEAAALRRKPAVKRVVAKPAAPQAPPATS